MKFENVQDSFNFYRQQQLSVLEQRAAQIEQEIKNNPAADMQAFDIELRGISEAKKDMLEARSGVLGTLRGIESMKVETRSFEADTVTGTPEYRSAFFKRLQGKALNETEQRAMQVAGQLVEQRAFNGAADSVAVIPEQTLNEIIRAAKKQSGLLGEVRHFAMPAYVKIPVGTSGTAAAWHTEGAEVAAESVELTTVTFAANEIVKIISISQKVRALSIPAFEAYITEELTEAVVACLSESIVNGTGNGQGKGIVSSITWDESNTVSAADVAYTDVVEALAILPASYAAGAKWAMNQATLYRLFYGMVDGQKRPVFIANPQNDGIGKLLGHEVIIDDYLPDNTAILGNFAKYAAVNIPEGITIEMSTQSSFAKNLIDYKATCVADTQVLVPAAFVKLAKTA